MKGSIDLMQYALCTHFHSGRNCLVFGTQPAYLSKLSLEGLGNLLPLHIAPLGEHVYDGLLIGSNPLHGFVEGLCIRVWVEMRTTLHADALLFNLQDKQVCS